MDDQDKTPWTDLSDQEVPGRAGVDLLAGASVKSAYDPHTEETQLEEDTFIPPWMVPEAQKADSSDTPELPRQNLSPDQMKAAIGLAIADVRSAAHGQAEKTNTASPRPNLDPKTAAVVASAMASVFSGLSDTRFSAQTSGAAQPGFEGFDNAEEIFRTMMGGSSSQGPNDAEAEPSPVASVVGTDFIQGPDGRADQPIVEVVDDITYAPRREKAAGGNGGSRTASAKPQKKTGKSAQGQPRGRGAKPYHGLTGRKKPQRYKIAGSARAKGMRGSPNLNKTSLNLAVQVKTLSSPSRAIPLFFLVLALILALAKFGVIDQYQRLADVQSELNTLKDQSSEVTKAISDYSGIQTEFLLYDDSWMTEAEKVQVDSQTVLEIIRRDLSPEKVRLVSVLLIENKLTVTISGVNLEVLSQLVQSLKDEPLVQSMVVQEMSRTDEVPLSTANATAPGTFKIDITLGEAPVETAQDTGQAGPADSGEEGQPQNEPVTVPQDTTGLTPGEEAIVPERPILPEEVGG